MPDQRLRTAREHAPTPETIRSPRELDGLSPGELARFADEVRRFLLANVSATGGHIGANLGTVELTLALHRAFESPRDALVFDTGHQGYTHKIVTGRASLFPTLNARGGMNRFLSRLESEHDPIEASHAGTAISIALGLALARRNAGAPGWAVAVVGDGALVEGMSLEALNHAAVERGTRLAVVLNDNGFAISPGFGGVHEALREGGERAAGFFRGLGLDYVGPVDGHDLPALEAALERAKATDGVPLVHAQTVKGHGWPPAQDHPNRRHFSFAFDPESGDLREDAGRATYPDVAAAEVERAMERDESIVAITPSTLYATGLERVFERFPARCFDPGMEEQHALSMTVGLALGGAKPVIAYQSTFLQRAFDQLLHDVCFLDVPVLILSFRSGFAGYDNPTHHGVYDLSYLRGLPNLTALYPKDRYEAQRMVQSALGSLDGPTMVLMPYGPVEAFEEAVLAEPAEAFSRPQVVAPGDDVLVLAVGNQFGVARGVAERLRMRGLDPGLVNLRRVIPLPSSELEPLLARHSRVVTLEQGVLDGGVGAEVAATITDRGLACELLRVGLPRTFVEPGSIEELQAAHGLDVGGVLARIDARWSTWEPHP